MSRSVGVALLVGLMALPAAATIPGTADAAGGTVAHQQPASRVGTRHEGMADPATTYRWDNAGNAQPTAALLQDERTSPRRNMLRIAEVALIVGLAGLGLAITFTSLLSDMKRRRRVVYRPRGP
jgi:hypothetical protein